MRYSLMHKNIVVADIEVDEVIGGITNIYDVFAPNHLPIGVYSKQNGKDVVDRYALNQWFADRCIPKHRMDIEEALEVLKFSARQLVIESWGLSLSDHYWLRPCDNELSNTALYENVNFFDNDFSEDVGDILLGLKEETDDINYWSPDNTTNGNLKKCWRIIDGKRCLLKSGSYPFKQQPFSEVIATRIVSYSRWLLYFPYSFSIADNFSLSGALTVQSTVLRISIICCWRSASFFSSVTPFTILLHFSFYCLIHE